MTRRLLIIPTGLILCQCLIGIQAMPHPPARAATQTAYDNKFDNVNIEEILGQERLLNNYIKCLESSGPCTPDAKMLKEILPDAILTDCVKCTEKQQYGAERVTRHLIDNRPLDWQRLEKIYDPEGTYRMKYLATKKSPPPQSPPTPPPPPRPQPQINLPIHDDEPHKA